MESARAVEKVVVTGESVSAGGYYEPDSMRGDVPNVDHPSYPGVYDSADGFDERVYDKSLVSVR